MGFVLHVQDLLGELRAVVRVRRDQEDILRSIPQLALLLEIVNDPTLAPICKYRLIDTSKASDAEKKRAKAVMGGRQGFEVPPGDFLGGGFAVGDKVVSAFERGIGEIMAVETRNMYLVRWGTSLETDKVRGTSLQRLGADESAENGACQRPGKRPAMRVHSSIFLFVFFSYRPQEPVPQGIKARKEPRTRGRGTRK